MINLILKEQFPTFTFITVNFANSAKAYTYKTVSEVEAGDLVVVNAPSGLTVVTVVDPAVAPFEPAGYEIKWIVDVVHTKLYKDLRKAEQTLAETQVTLDVHDETVTVAKRL